MNTKFAKQAFTLAEVLITLAIIGVVAALLIPALINNINNKELATAEKKARSVLSNAFMKAKLDNGGTLEGFDFGSHMGDYIKLAENCNLTGSSHCWSNKAQILQDNGSLGKWSGTENAGALTIDGMYILFWDGPIQCKESSVNEDCYVRSSNAGFCGEFYVDINGPKQPNVFGKDIREIGYFSDGYLSFPGDSGGRAEYTWIPNQPEANYDKDYKGAGTKCYDSNDYTQTVYE